MNSDELRAKWNSLKTAWEQGSRASISPEEFSEIFYDGSAAREAVQLARRSAVAFRMLQKAAVKITDVSDSDVASVVMTVLGEDEIDGMFATARSALLPGDRPEFLSEIVREFVRTRGRKFAREIALNKWWRLPLIQEEREGLVEGLKRGGILEASFFRLLGPDALRFASRPEYASIEIDGPTAVFTSTNTRSDLRQTASRFDALLATSSLSADLRDAGLTQAELGLLSTTVPGLAPNWSALAKALRYAARRGPEFEELAYALSRATPFVPSPQSYSDGLIAWQFPVLRLLHLQQILEAPRLSRTARDPALVLVPDAALYLLGRDDVFYQPELRIQRGAERRWRARWIESAGEAASIMFLEDTLQLDLASLARIPERNNEETPDFMAETVSRERLVFESKGATNWETHLAQRRKALKQLGKNAIGTGGAWVGTGRTFACSLFAASQGDDRSSLLHVDDPPFAFEELFREGWKHRCRREHAVAMLEAARIFDAADELNQRGRFSSEQVQVEMFNLGEGEENDARRFVGHYLPLGEWARTLRHPNPKICERIRIFLGIGQEHFNSFARGEFPTLSDRVRLHSESDTESNLVAGPSVGVLPGGETGGAPRGIFSTLADGSFMALEFDQGPP